MLIQLNCSWNRNAPASYLQCKSSPLPCPSNAHCLYVMLYYSSDTLPAYSVSPWASFFCKYTTLWCNHPVPNLSLPKGCLSTQRVQAERREQGGGSGSLTSVERCHECVCLDVKDFILSDKTCEGKTLPENSQSENKLDSESSEVCFSTLLPHVQFLA